MRRNKGRKHEAEHHTSTVKGTICNAGIDFVDVLSKEGRVTTILVDKIDTIHWVDPNCNPCDGVCCIECDHCEHSSCDDYNCSCYQYFHNQPMETICLDGHHIPKCDHIQFRRHRGVFPHLSFELFRHIGCEAEIHVSR
ncbi:hypothetical protein [Bacillus vallismortis]|uniref:hypothetical protein n=1 Tax=Bacillus vallismortis TaxID=72361 RepID=UPI0011568690|nr:hypothetical protein [Bacillus vallismortis]